MPTSEELRRLSGVGSAAIATPTVVEDTVGTAPSPATTGTSLTPVSVTGYPDPATDGAFEVLTYAPADIPSAEAVEILRVTALAAGVWTIERQQYNSPALSIAAGWELRWTADAMALDLRAYLEGLALEDSIGGPPAVMQRTVYTSGSGTHTYDTETVTVSVIVIGYGGAGGGADGPAVGTATAGGGGGGGGVAQKMFLKGSDTSCTYNINASNSTVDPGAAANIVGNAGSVGSQGVANAGALGGVGGGAGGSASGGDMNSTGSGGVAAVYYASFAAISGSGGGSVMGGGGVGKVTTTSGGGSNGGDGGNYGGGGGGAASGLTGGSRTGGTGGNPLIIIDEYGIGV